MKQKNESLAEMGELKRFIMSLDDFLNWLQQTSEPCSSEDLPQSLSEAESLLDAHFELQVSSDLNLFTFWREMSSAMQNSITVFVPQNIEFFVGTAYCNKL